MFVDRTNPVGTERLRRNMDEIDYSVPNPERPIINENSNEARLSFEQGVQLTNAIEQVRRERVIPPSEPPEPPRLRGNRTYSKNNKYSQEQRDYLRLFREHGSKWKGKTYAAKVKVPLHMIHSWMKVLRTNNSLEYKRDRHSYRCLLSPAHLRYLSDEIDGACEDMTLSSMTEKLAEAFPGSTEVSPSTVSRALKGERIKEVMGREYSIKRVTFRPEVANSPQNKEKRWASLVKLKSCLTQGGYVWVSIEETHWVVGPRRSVAWSQVGKKAYSKAAKQRTEFSSISATDSNGGAPLCLIVKDTVTAEVFEQFLRGLLGRYPSWEKCLFFMDNARVHKEDTIKRMLESANHHYVFNAPYTPEMNPIEVFFSQWKDTAGQSMQKWPGEEAFLNHLRDAVLAIDSASIRKLFHHVQEKAFPKILAEEDL